MDLQDPFASLGDLVIPHKPKRIRRKPPPKTITLPAGAAFLGDVNEYAGDHKGYELEPLVKKNLAVGDYSIQTPQGLSLEDQVVVERKSLVNLVGDCAGDNRERFERCLERLKQVRYSCLLIEASWRQIAAGSFPFSRMHPSSVLGSLVAWSMRYGVHVWLVGNREEGAEATMRILGRYLQEVLSDGQEQAQG